MSRRPRRWKPKGAGWLCLTDSGVTAWWARREPDHTITSVIYIGYGTPEARYWGIWTFTCRPGAHIMNVVWDKPHRVVWLLEEPTHPEDPTTLDYLGGQIVGWRPIPSGPARRAPKLRSGNWWQQKYSSKVHSMRYRRTVTGALEPGTLPRKFRNEGSTP